MRNILRRAVLPVVLIMLCALCLGGCLFNPINIADSGIPNYDFTDMRQSVSEGYFKLSIHTDKDEFSKNEQIDCYAELEYIGDDDSITVYASSDKLIDMSMTGKNINYYSSIDFSLMQEPITLQKGVPVRLALSECVPKSSSALPGQYQIDANCNFSLSPDEAVNYYGHVSAVINITDAK